MSFLTQRSSPPPALPRRTWTVLLAATCAGNAQYTKAGQGQRRGLGHLRCGADRAYDIAQAAFCALAPAADSVNALTPVRITLSAFQARKLKSVMVLVELTTT